MAILVKPTPSILFAQCAFDVALSPPRFPAHSLPVAPFLIHLFSWQYVEVGPTVAVWESLSKSEQEQWSKTSQNLKPPRPAE